MEVSIFTKPAVRAHLERLVEARLHLDNQESAAGVAKAEEYTAYAKRLVHSTGIPIYAIIDPNNPEKLLATFAGADLSGGEKFRAFLAPYTGP